MTDTITDLDYPTIDEKPNVPSRAELARPWLRRWLKIIVFMIFCMVLIGGATRLTNSGLSITEWQPIIGAIPPLSAADWQIAFGKYQQSSQYKLQNQGMELSQFQFIFWWEWAHRNMGRLIAVAFLPLLIMGLAGRLEKRQWLRLFGLLVLLGLQGALGWYMVVSGLQGRVDVSQYRLSAHLTLATVFFAAVLWTIMSIGKRHSFPRSLDQWAAVFLLALVFLQIAAGGFVAGLDAGQGDNSWPLMDDQWIPKGLYSTQPIWKNFFENAMTVQFHHRILAYAILVLSVWHGLRTFTLSAMLLIYAVLTQACIGILTLLMHVPIGVALIHQAGALVVLATAVWNLNAKTAQDIA
jgi:cytochrome c oxidase assembly protein subunit 15